MRVLLRVTLPLSSHTTLTRAVRLICRAAFAVKTGVDSALYAVGLRDEVKGTGVFGKIELKREGGTGDKLGPEATDAISNGLFFIAVAAACSAITAAGY